MAARQSYQYGTSPRKIKPEYDYSKTKKTVSKKNNNKKKSKKVQVEQNKKAETIILVVIGFIILLAISYRNTLINERFAEIKNLKANLAAITKENEQLEVNIENSLNLSNIEKEAKERLGMQKLTNKQTVYISLPKKDYVEPATEEVIIEKELDWFENIVNKIFGN